MDGKIIRLSVVDSTNIYTSKMLSQSDIPEWTTVVADHQTQGKGQRGRVWESQLGRNLLCSTVIYPTNLMPDQNFIIAMLSSVAVVSLLETFDISAQIKWPNDILVNEKKIAGILVENQIVRNRIESSVVGLGLNVNQTSFSDYPWQPTSMIIERNVHYDLDEVMHRFKKCLCHEYVEALKAPGLYYLRYAEKLYGLQSVFSFQHGKERIQGAFIGVDALGNLHLESQDGIRKFSSGEIRIVNT